MSIKLFVLCGTLCWLAACTSQETFKGTDVLGVPWGGDFALTDHTGKRFNSTDLHGKVVVLFFGYTHCPDICAPTLVKLAQAIRRLDSDAERVRVLFVTVDPKHDTPSQLAGFVPQFHPAFTGLTGSDAEIAAVTRMYNVPFERDSAIPNGVIHSGAVMAKDMQGRMRLLWKNEADVDDIAHDLRLLLRQPR